MRPLDQEGLACAHEPDASSAAPGVHGEIHLLRPALLALAQIDVEQKGWT